jgi:hypothetical protein
MDNSAVAADRTSGGDMVLSGKVIEFEARRGLREHTQIDISAGFSDVPVMPATLLLMELCGHGSSVDLNQMEQIVLSDPGAAIQILREAGQECALGWDRSIRIADCISALGAMACIEVAARKTVSRAMNKRAIARVWQHSIDIAKNCCLMARRDMNPDEAYLAGLLHELGSLPSLLEWNAESAAWRDPVTAGLKLAIEWNLPWCVAEYFSELAHLRGTCRWSHMVQRAHDMPRVLPATYSFVYDAEICVFASSTL